MVTGVDWTDCTGGLPHGCGGTLYLGVPIVALTGGCGVMEYVGGGRCLAEETGQIVVAMGRLKVLIVVEFVLTIVVREVPQTVEVVIGGGGQLEVVCFITLCVVGNW